MDRRKTREILWHVFEFAKQDRVSLMQSYSSFPNDSKETVAIRKDIVAIEGLQQRIFGHSRTAFDDFVENSEAINILSVSGMKRFLELENDTDRH